jgi:hypothetical protein
VDGCSDTASKGCTWISEPRDLLCALQWPPPTQQQQNSTGFAARLLQLVEPRACVIEVVGCADKGSVMRTLLTMVPCESDRRVISNAGPDPAPDGSHRGTC